MLEWLAARGLTHAGQSPKHRGNRLEENPCALRAFARKKNEGNALFTILTVCQGLAGLDHFHYERVKFAPGDRDVGERGQHRGDTAKRRLLPI